MWMERGMVHQSWHGLMVGRSVHLAHDGPCTRFVPDSRRRRNRIVAFSHQDEEIQNILFDHVGGPQ